jgi:6-phosphogluconolactonase (cycloisomerase 2 family)
MQRTVSLLLVFAALACNNDGATTLSPLNDVDAARTTGAAGQVYTMSNAVSGNAVMAFDRATDGSLTPAGSYATGGSGSGGGLGNQSALVITRNGRHLLAVNAGSNEVSSFRIRLNGSLELVNRVPSGGVSPISVTHAGGFVYVLNGGGTGNITGFLLSTAGTLTPIAGSSRSLSSSAAGAAQVEFSPDGRWLVVTEKATNVIDTYAVNGAGMATGPVVNASVGATPFGFSFAPNGVLVVSEAFGGAPDASAVSSYRLQPSGALGVISPSVATTETAACWILITPNGRYAYTTNTGSGTISGYRMERGTLTLLDADGVTGTTGAGSGPIDLAMTRDGAFLYSLNSGTGTVSAFSISSTGALTSAGGASALPASANGLAAR